MPAGAGTGGQRGRRVPASRGGLRRAHCRWLGRDDRGGHLSGASGDRRHRLAAARARRARRGAIGGAGLKSLCIVRRRFVWAARSAWSAGATRPWRTLALTEYAARVVVLHRGPALSAQQTYQQRVLAHPSIGGRGGVSVAEVLGRTRSAASACAPPSRASHHALALHRRTPKVSATRGRRP